jgi:acyl carrier protein
MKLSSQDVLDVIYGCIDEVNRQLPHDARLLKSADTVLVGEGGVLDSLGYITLLVALEEALETKLGARCFLLEEDIMADQNGPYHSIDSLSKWIVAKAV